jgi:hypothetical protein
MVWLQRKGQSRGTELIRAVGDSVAWNENVTQTCTLYRASSGEIKRKRFSVVVIWNSCAEEAPGQVFGTVEIDVSESCGMKRYDLEGCDERAHIWMEIEVELGDGIVSPSGTPSKESAKKNRGPVGGFGSGKGDTGVHSRTSTPPSSRKDRRGDNDDFAAQPSRQAREFVQDERAREYDRKYDAPRAFDDHLAFNDRDYDNFGKYDRRNDRNAMRDDYGSDRRDGNGRNDRNDRSERNARGDYGGRYDDDRFADRKYNDDSSSYYSSPSRGYNENYNGRSNDGEFKDRSYDSPGGDKRSVPSDNYFHDNDFGVASNPQDNLKDFRKGAMRQTTPPSSRTTTPTKSSQKRLQAGASAWA